MQELFISILQKCKKTLDNSQKCEYIKTRKVVKNMCDFDKLQELIKEKNYSDKAIANILNIDISTWYRRKLAPNKITIGEAQKIKEVLNIPNDLAIRIFLE